MVAISITLYSIFLVSCFHYTMSSRTLSIFSLKPLFLLFALLEIPYLLYLNLNRETLDVFVAASLTSFDSAFIKHIYLKTIFIVIALVGMNYVKPRPIVLARVFDISKLSEIKLKANTKILFILTLIVFAYINWKIGGVFNLMSNMSDKTNILSGTGLSRNMLMVCAQLSLGYMIVASKNRERIGVSFLIVLLVFFLMLAIGGERKNPLLLLFFALIVYNFHIDKIKLAGSRVVVFFLFALLFSMFAPVLRQPDSFAYYSQNINYLFIDSFAYIGELFKRFSEIDISLFIYSHFDSSDAYWYGRSFGDLITGLIPSSIYPLKPPIDEGVYIYALAHNLNVLPPTAFVDMYPVGWPLSRVTSGYVNFGIVGVVVYSFITGMILKYVEALVLLSNKSPASIIIYVMMLTTGFGISNAFLANTMIMISLIVIIVWGLKVFMGKE